MNKIIFPQLETFININNSNTNDSYSFENNFSISSDSLEKKPNRKTTSELFTFKATEKSKKTNFNFLDEDIKFKPLLILDKKNNLFPKFKNIASKPIIQEKEDSFNRVKNNLSLFKPINSLKTDKMKIDENNIGTMNSNNNSNHYTNNLINFNKISNDKFNTSYIFAKKNYF